MSSTTSTPPSPPAEPTADAVVTDARKAAENEAKSAINRIWQQIEDAAEWPVEKIEALLADLKKHV